MEFIKTLFGWKSKPCEEREPAFMACLIMVNYESSRWQKAVSRVLGKMVVVRSCTIGEDGLLEVSGLVHPKVLMKVLAKTRGRADLAWIQFGECSQNLYGPDRRNFVKVETIDAVPPPPPPTHPSSPPYHPPSYHPFGSTAYDYATFRPRGYPYAHGDGYNSCNLM